LFVDESAITGESLLVEKQVDHDLSCGSKVGSGEAIVQIIGVASGSLLGKSVIYIYLKLES
jgi:cation transport ATPase